VSGKAATAAFCPKRHTVAKKDFEQGCFYAWELSVLHDERCACRFGARNPSFLFSARVCARCHSGIAHHHDRLHDIIKALSKTARRNANCREDRHHAHTENFPSDSAPIF
jgi:hypothetical protein